MKLNFGMLVFHFCILSLFSVIAQTFDLQLIETQNDHSNGGIYQVRAEIRAQSGSFGAGSGNFVLDYDEAALDTGSTSIAALMPLAFSGEVSPAPLISYQDMTITRTFVNTLTLGTELNSVSSGQTVTTDWLPFALVTFTIIDENLSSGLGWRIGQPNANTVLFLDDEVNLLTAGNLSGRDDALPVELTAFNATALENIIRLNWTTQSEVNNLGFEIYRSVQEADGFALQASYLTDASLEGAGNSNIAITYQFDDNQVQAEQTYWYKIADVDFDGIRTFHGPIQVKASSLLPAEFALRPNFPNPFNPSTKIQYEVPSQIQNKQVNLVIYNSLGMKIKTLVSAKTDPGIHVVEWNGTNDRGVKMASGIFFVRMETGNFQQTRKMILIR